MVAHMFGSAVYVRGLSSDSEEDTLWLIVGSFHEHHDFQNIVDIIFLVTTLSSSTPKILFMWIIRLTVSCNFMSNTRNKGTSSRYGTAVLHRPLHCHLALCSCKKAWQSRTKIQSRTLLSQRRHRLRTWRGNDSRFCNKTFYNIFLWRGFLRMWELFCDGLAKLLTPTCAIGILCSLPDNWNLSLYSYFPSVRHTIWFAIAIIYAKLKVMTDFYYRKEMNLFPFVPTPFNGKSWLLGMRSYEHEIYLWLDSEFNLGNFLPISIQRLCRSVRQMPMESCVENVLQFTYTAHLSIGDTFTNSKA